MTEREQLIDLLTDVIGMSIAAKADHLLSNGVTLQRWIPVTERLPEHYVNVLVIVTARFSNITLEHAMLLAYYEHKCGWILEMFPEIENPVVTHWMPLPEPPKEEDHEAV